MKGSEPKVNTEGSTEEMLKDSESFRKLVTECPRHPRTDAALYSLARVLARLGKDSSVEYYQQLIKGFPKSPFSIQDGLEISTEKSPLIGFAV